MQYPDRREFRLLLLLLDLCALIVAFQLAIETRLGLNTFYDFQMTRSMIDLRVPPPGLILLLWIPMSAWLELYRPRRAGLIGGAFQVVESVIAVAGLTIIVTFFVRGLGTDFSRSFVLFFTAYSLATLTASRIVLRAALGFFQKNEYIQERLAIAGSGEGAKRLVDYLETAQPLGTKLCGVIRTSDGPMSAALGNPVPVLGHIDDIGALINTHRIDRVVALESEVGHIDLERLAATCTRMGVALHRLPAHVETSGASIRVHRLGRLNVLEVHGFEFTATQAFAKRVFDLGAGSLLFLANVPLMTALACLIKLTSRGPVLYVAPRVGKGGRHFPFYKFRSMVADAETRRDALAHEGKDGHIFKIRNDPRLTPVGRLMRRFSLDELPQLLNVLKGDMSLVGPRPLPACDLEADGMSREHAFWAHERSRILPGITGLWQIEGRSDLGFEEMIHYDIAYARTWSLYLDLRILLLTLPAILRRRGAY